jgi:hypothetical protein
MQNRHLSPASKAELIGRILVGEIAVSTDDCGIAITADIYRKFVAEARSRAGPMVRMVPT